VDDAGATIAIDADVRRLADIRAFIRARAEAAGAEPGHRDDLVQAVDELVTNVIEHGYGERPGRVEVEVERAPSGLVVRIRDGAPAFDPSSVPTPRLDLPLAERPFGGMGVHLARTLTDAMRHRILPDGGNEVTLEKALN